MAQDATNRQTKRAVYVMLGVMAFQAWGLFAMLGHARSRQLLNLFTFKSEHWQGWVGAGVVAALFVALTLRSLPYIRKRFFDINALKILAVPFALGAGALEELLFRRILMDWLNHTGHSILVQIAASAAAFGLLHAAFGIFSGSWRGIVSPVIWTTALGAGLAVVYLLASRDVAPCIWSHALIDLCIEPWLLVAVMKHVDDAEQAQA